VVTRWSVVHMCFYWAVALGMYKGISSDTGSLCTMSENLNFE
jgi:hypothetical protein